MTDAQVLGVLSRLDFGKRSGRKEWCCSLFHVVVHLREVVLHDIVGGAVGDGSKAKLRLNGVGVGEAPVLHPGQIGELLSANL